MLNCRLYVVRILTLLLQLVQGVVKTSDPLTDLGMPPRGLISHLFTGSIPTANVLMHLMSQRTLLAGWFSIRWRGMQPMWETQENWLQTFPLRPCLNSLIPRRTSVRQSSPTLGTWEMGKKRTLHTYKLGHSLGTAKSGCHHLVCRAGTWSKGPSRSFATITHSRGTTHCGWMLEWIWPNIHRWSLTPTPWMCKSWVSQSYTVYTFYIIM